MVSGRPLVRAELPSTFFMMLCWRRKTSPSGDHLHHGLLSSLHQHLMTEAPNGSFLHCLGVDSLLAVPRPFQREPDFDASGVNYTLQNLLAGAEDLPSASDLPRVHPQAVL